MYREHVARLQEEYEECLAKSKYDALVIASGRPPMYYLDDQHAPFRPNPHFAHWCPDRSPGHLLEIRPGNLPKLHYFQPDDFWHEVPNIEGADWAEMFDIRIVKDPDALWDEIPKGSRIAFLGEDTSQAQTHKLDLNPTPLMTHLSWIRAEKSPYEIDCIRKANQLSARGHRAAKKAFEAGASELAIHLAYLQAIPCLEEELPYGSIVGLDAKSAILHYQHKRSDDVDARLLLIDNGAQYRGYAADITRTHLRKDTPSTLRELSKGLDQVQQSLAQKAVPGTPFKNLNREAHILISQLLIDTGIFRGLDAESAVAAKLSSVFMPHGLGHMLGLLVHDVGGEQSGPNGGEDDACPDFPKLRMRRALRENEVVTIEPGLYFIPMKLNELRTQPTSEHIDWGLVDELSRFGGFRIEDNVVAQAQGALNLTREFLDHGF